jgi:Holliday junction resolvase-like predicted endonuclease
MGMVALWWLVFQHERLSIRQIALPWLSVTPGKQHLLFRTAHRFLAERRVLECPCRFDVLAIDNSPGHSPVVRLHKDAFSPEM